MSYIETLSGSQKEAIKLMVQSMNKRGITNKFMQAGIIAIVSKESNFRPKSEKGYGGTSNERIRKIFGKRVSDLSEAALSALKKDNEAFFNKVYGGRYGNAQNEGYKYRGRGLNQITFKGNYQAMSKYTDADIVANPDLLNTLPVAVDVLVGYFLRNLKSPKNKLDEYNMTDMNSATSVEDAVGAAYHANAGWGKDKKKLEKSNSNGRKRAFARVGDLYEYAQKLDPESGWEEPEGTEINSGGDQQSDHNQGGNTPIGTTISASVGAGGKNREADVLVVQTLLNKKNNARLVVDGKCGPKTEKAIRAFQKDKVGLSRPDSRIDVGGKTWGVLAEGSTADDLQNTGAPQEEGSVQSIPLDASIHPCFN